MRRDRAGRVSLIDLGGSTPGITRRYAPSLSFRVEGFAALRQRLLPASSGKIAPFALTALTASPHENPQVSRSGRLAPATTAAKRSVGKVHRNMSGPQQRMATEAAKFAPVHRASILSKSAIGRPRIVHGARRSRCSSTIPPCAITTRNPCPCSNPRRKSLACALALEHRKAEPIFDSQKQ